MMSVMECVDMDVHVGIFFVGIVVITLAATTMILAVDKTSINYAVYYHTTSAARKCTHFNSLHILYVSHFYHLYSELLAICLLTYHL